VEGKKARPVWVWKLLDFASGLSILLLLLVVVITYQNLRTTSEAVVELRHLNTFFMTTLVDAQRRADSLRTIQRMRIDSLEKANRQ
jgi:hypothetical protein